MMEKLKRFFELYVGNIPDAVYLKIILIGVVVFLVAFILGLAVG